MCITVLTGQGFYFIIKKRCIVVSDKRKCKALTVIIQEFIKDLFDSHVLRGTYIRTRARGDDEYLQVYTCWYSKMPGCLLNYQCMVKGAGGGRAVW